MLPSSISGGSDKRSDERMPSLLPGDKRSGERMFSLFWLVIFLKLAVSSHDLSNKESIRLVTFYLHPNLPSWESLKL